MSFRIQTNVNSLITQRQLGINQQKFTQALTRLSSGFRINSAADDAAGLGISENLRAHIRSYAQAERNTNVAISMSQTAESGADSISQVIIRMRELAVQSSNGSLTTTDRALLDTEFQELKQEVERLAEATEFNGRELLAGTASTISFQVGISLDSYDLISVGFGGVGLTTLGIEKSRVDGPDATKANLAITALDSALTSVSQTRAGFGAATNRLTFAVNHSEDIRFNLEAANSAIRDADIAAETASLARYQILVQAGASVLAQANIVPSYALNLLNAS
jgi:flagellin